MNNIAHQSSFTNLFPEITDDSNLKILDIWNSYRGKVTPSEYTIDAYVEYTPTSSDTLPSIAYNFYGSTKLWWMIPLINDAEDPFDFLDNIRSKSGTIKLIRSEYMPGIIFSMNRAKNSESK